MNINAASNTVNNPNDSQVAPPPTDTVQCLKWASCPQNLLAATGWDCKPSVWEISPQGQSVPKAQTTLQDPALSLSWKTDVSSIFLGCCDNQVKLWNLAANSVTTIGQHNAPVREVIWCDSLASVISGGWDGMVAFWDGRQQRPTTSVNVGGRIFGMSMVYPLLVAILSDKRYAVWNLERVRSGVINPEIGVDNSMKYQIRSVSCANDAKGFVIGHIEGRCSLKKVMLEPTIKIDTDFMFKCHRDQLAHALNAVCFNLHYGTFATGATDGAIVLWDRVVKQKVKTFTGLGGPVTAMDFKMDSSLFAYAIGYDWHKGIEGSGSVQPKIHYRQALEDAKPKTGRTW